MAGEYTINYTDAGKGTFIIYPHETNGPGNISTPRPITGVDTTLEQFKILGDFTYRFVAGFVFTVQNSTGNNGSWTVAIGGATYSAGTNTTTIPVTGNITNGVVDGQIVYSAESNTPLLLPGRGTLNYGEKLNEDLIKLLENFSNTTAPSNPTRGQLWHDTTNGVLKVYSGVSWESVAANYVLKAGDTMTGALVLNADPTLALHAATKQYVDAGRNPGYQYFTATAGQTLFTLINFSYTIGSNRLMVFVNGVKQVLPPNGNYTETSTSSFTFSPGLNLNDRVEAYLLY